MKLMRRIIDKKRHAYCSAVIAAAGSFQRMNGENKILADLCGSPVIVHTLKAFQDSDFIDEIIVVARADDIVPIGELCIEHGITKAARIIVGGDTRLESVYIGLSAASSKAKLAAIQDGDRPLVTGEIIADAVTAAKKYKAAVPGVAVIDTLKKTKDGFISMTADRAEFVAVQTPQVFNMDIIKPALQNAIEKDMDITDDSMAAEALGLKARITKGSYENIKITTPSDLEAAEAIMRRRNTSP